MADELLLRDWTRLTDVTVVELNDDGVTLRDGRLIGWDRIESGQIGVDQQAAFDQSIRDLGEPLFRLRQRLQLSDDDQVLELAESLWPRYRERTGEAAMLVSVGLMRGRLAAGQRASAVLPYLFFLQQLQRSDVDGTSERAGLDEASVHRAQREFGVSIDPATGLCGNLLPLWQDSDAAQAASQELLEWLAKQPPPLPLSASVYAATLAAFAGDPDAAQTQLEAIPLASDALIELRTVVTWQLALQQEPAMSIRSIESNLDKLLPRNQAIALYWLGVAGLNVNNDNRQQIARLHLLQIPAEHPGEADAAAAALHEVVEYYRTHAANATAATDLITVRAELLKAYPNSWFAEQERER